MRFRHLLIVALLVTGADVLVSQAQSRPTITYEASVFTVEFPAGAVAVSVLFKSTNEDYIAGKNWLTEPETTRITEDWSMVNCTYGGPTDCPSGADWHVWGEVQYENPDHTYRELKTNVLTVRH